MIRNALICCGVGLLVAACGGESHQDLRAWMQDQGKGVKGKAGNVGDELVTVRIVMPDTIDDSLSYFFSEWRQKNTYDPGRK